MEKKTTAHATLLHDIWRPFDEPSEVRCQELYRSLIFQLLQNDGTSHNVAPEASIDISAIIQVTSLACSNILKLSINDAASIKALVETISSKFLSSPKAFTQLGWKKLLNEPLFKRAVNEHIEELRANILEGKDNQKIYDTFGSCFFLLGGSEDIDILIDVRKFDSPAEVLHGQPNKKIMLSEIIKLLDEKIQRARDLHIETMREYTRPNISEILKIEIQSIVQLSELINKLAVLHSPSFSGRHIAHNLAEALIAKIKEAIDYFDSAGYISEEMKRLKTNYFRFIINHSHYSEIDKADQYSIQSSVTEISDRIRNAKLGLMDLNALTEDRRLVAEANIATYSLVATKSRDNIVGSACRITEFPNFRANDFLSLRDLYNHERKKGQTSHALHVYQEKKVESNEEMILDFIEISAQTQFHRTQIEMIHNVVLCDNTISNQLLSKLCIFLASQPHYQNMFYEEWKVKTLSIILEKLAFDKNVWSSLGSLVYNYINRNIHGLGAHSGHLYIFLSLALFYAERGVRSDINSEVAEKAIECYTKFAQLFGIKENNEQEILHHAKSIHSLENLISAFGSVRILMLSQSRYIQTQINRLATESNKLTKVSQEDTKTILTSICRLIDNLFYNITTSEVSTCLNNCTKCERLNPKTWKVEIECRPKALWMSKKHTRGIKDKCYPLETGFYLHIRYPASAEIVFDTVYQSYEHLINESINNILRDILQKSAAEERNHQLKATTQKAEHRLYHDHTTNCATTARLEKDIIDLWLQNYALLTIPNFAAEVWMVAAPRAFGDNKYKLEENQQGLEHFFRDFREKCLDPIITKYENTWQVYFPKVMGSYLFGSSAKLSRADIEAFMRDVRAQITQYRYYTPSQSTPLFINSIFSAYQDQSRKFQEWENWNRIYNALRIAMRDARPHLPPVFYDTHKHSTSGNHEIQNSYVLIQDALEGVDWARFFGALQPIRPIELVEYEYAIGAVKEDSWVTWRMLEKAQAVLESTKQEYIEALREKSYYEWLARLRKKWEFSNESIVGPLGFIEAAKGRWVLFEVTRSIIRSVSESPIHRNTPFSLNVTWDELIHPNYIQQLKDTFSEFGIDPKKVTLEVLETAMENESEACKKISKIQKELGCRLALDDVGAVNSNPTRIDNIVESGVKIHVLKIDGWLVTKIISPSKRARENAERYISLIVNIGERIGALVVAEQVEDFMVLKTLKSLDVAYIQGYIANGRPKNLL